MNKKNAFFICLISTICAVIIDLLFFLLNIIVALTGLALWLEKRKELHASPYALPWLLLTLILSPWLFVRDSSWLYALNFLTCAGLAMLFWVNAQKQSLTHLVMSCTVPFQFLRLILVKMNVPLNTFLHSTASVPEKRIKMIKSALLALPVVLFVAILLYSADLVVSKYVDSILNIRLITENFSHVFIIVYFFLFCGLFYSLLRNHSIQKNGKNGIVITQQDKLVLQIMAVAVGILVLAFSFIQLKYLFAGADVIGRLGIGYQEYAHRGFYQLLIASLIIFFIIWLLGKEYVNNQVDTLLSPLNLVISFVLIGETIFLLISAMKRLWLFVDALEWAPKRFFAFEGMIFFIVVLLLFCIHLVIKRYTRQQFLYTFSLLFVLNVVVINVMNPDRFIAKQNVQKYVVEKAEEHELDFDYSAYVSADGINEGIVLYQQARTDKEKFRAAQKLSFAWYRLQRYQEEQQQHWYLFHISKNDAYKKLQPLSTELEQFITEDREEIDTSIK